MEMQNRYKRVPGKGMNRKEFLKRASLGVIALVGGGAALRYLPGEGGPGAGPGLAHTRKFVCTGDSWTSGNQDGTGTTYPALLATALPWASVTKDGHAGWTSTEIAARWGVPFTLGAFTTASDATTQTPVSITAPTTAYRTNTRIKFGWVGQLRLADGTAMAGTLRHAASSATWSDGWSFQRAAAGSAVSVPAGSQFVCSEMDAYRGHGLIISMGRNNSIDPAVVVRDVSAILDTRTANTPYVVLAVPTAVTERAGTLAYSRIESTNAALRAAFPNEFTDIRCYMIDRGLVVTATSPDSADLDGISADTIPQSLMIAAGDHPNATGYKAVTACVLDGLARVGALSGPSSGVAGVTTTAIGSMIWIANDIRDPLGTTINSMLDRAGCTKLRAASTSAAPTLYHDVTSGRRYLSFDGADDRMYGITNGDVSQPFTIIAKVRFRDLSTVAQGVVWSYGSPGATLSVSTSGRVALDAESAVQTSPGTVVERTTTTIAGVANGTGSAVGIAGAAFTTGDAGARGLLTQLQVGYYFDTAARHALMDLFELRFYPWALTDAQIAAIANRSTDSPA